MGGPSADFGVGVGGRGGFEGGPGGAAFGAELVRSGLAESRVVAAELIDRPVARAGFLKQPDEGRYGECCILHNASHSLSRSGRFKYEP